MNDLDQFLRDNRPSAPEEGQFLIETNARLNAVEGLKKTVDTERRFGRRALVLALVAGLILGCLVTAFVLLCPVVHPAWMESGHLATTLAFLQARKIYFILPTAVFAIALGVRLVTKKA